MKTNKNIRTLTAAIIGMVATVLFATACDGQLDVNQRYGFELETLPVQKKIGLNQTAEIRCQIIREGYYIRTEYFIRYFQSDGKGELKLDDGTVFEPNDLYPLDRETFRLYYTSHCTDQQTITIWLTDSFGQTMEKSFSFQNETTD